VLTQLLQSGLSIPRPVAALVSQCAVCRSWPADPVCEPCIARFCLDQRRCGRCALGLPADLSMGLHHGPALCGACARQAPPLDATLAGVTYSFPWSSLIGQYKFGGHHGWSGFFARLLLGGPEVKALFLGLEKTDWIVPMPLSAQRLEARGFNQSWKLALALARQSASAATADAGLLLRTRHTRPQSELKREARLANVKGAFQAEPLRAALLRGRHVVLVDDVMTSGASLFTAAEALRSAGAARVSAVVLARTQ
jgi:ComF family protein